MLEVPGASGFNIQSSIQIIRQSKLLALAVEIPVPLPDLRPSFPSPPGNRRHLQKQAGKILDRRILVLKQDLQAFPVLFGNPGLPDETVQLIHDFDPFPFRLRPLLAILADVDLVPLPAEFLIRTVASADSTKMSHGESLVVSRARISLPPRMVALV